MAIGKVLLKLHGPLKWVVPFGLSANLLYAIFIFFGPKDESAQSLASDLANLVVPIIGAWACFGIGKTAHAKELGCFRFAPALIGWNSIFYALGQVTYLVETHVLKSEAYPTWSDIPYLLSYPALMAAILVWPGATVPKTMRWRMLADGLMITSGLFALSWLLVIGPTFESATSGGFATLVATAYPAWDVFLAVGLIQVMRKGCTPRLKTTTGLLVISTLITVLADVVFAHQTLKETYITGSVIDLGWPVSMWLSNVAGIMLKQTLVKDRKAIVAETLAEDWSKQRPSAMNALAPYLFVPAVGALLLMSPAWKLDRFLLNGLYVSGVILMVCVIGRQLLSIFESQALFDRLKDAYRQLEFQNRLIQHQAQEAVILNEELRTLTQDLEVQNEALVRANTQLEHLATIDGMTGLANHRAFQERLRGELSLAERQGDNLVVALADVDSFKQYNDSFGHPAGDAVLKQIAEILREEIRGSDTAARYGGEEFALILPHIGSEAAASVLERIRRRIETTEFEHRQVTISIGFALMPKDGKLAETLIKSADKALYQAKREGRNRVKASGPAHSKVA